ncbi:hypothetical protein NHQ30_011336 [Ciborinia camelliae]|nr:hypothetical protein NHQ30_011336 [Ciborinia camelliae]
MADLGKHSCYVFRVGRVAKTPGIHLDLRIFFLPAIGVDGVYPLNPTLRSGRAAKVAIEPLSCQGFLRRRGPAGRVLHVVRGGDGEFADDRRAACAGDRIVGGKGFFNAIIAAPIE